MRKRSCCPHQSAIIHIFSIFEFVIIGSWCLLVWICMRTDVNMIGFDRRKLLVFAFFKLLSHIWFLRDSLQDAIWLIDHLGFVENSKINLLHPSPSTSLTVSFLCLQIFLVNSWGGVHMWTTSHHSPHAQAVGAGGPASHAKVPCHWWPRASSPLGFTRWSHHRKLIPDQLL